MWDPEEIPGPERNAAFFENDTWVAGYQSPQGRLGNGDECFVSGDTIFLQFSRHLWWGPP